MKAEIGASASSWGRKKEVNTNLKDQVDNRVEITCTAAEWKSVRAYLINESTTADFSNDKEKTEYLSKELNRLQLKFSS